MEPRYQCIGLGPGWSWRLLGSNHRALARASGTFATLDAATADALEVGAAAAEAGIEVLPGRGTTWNWELTVDGLLRATSVVPYARRLECVRAVVRFRQCAPAAQVSATPLVRHPGSGRARRTGPRGAGQSPGESILRRRHPG
jgi:hypothetical protein